MLRIHFQDADLSRVRVARAPDPLWETVPGLYRLGADSDPPVFAAWRRHVRAAVHEQGLHGAIGMLRDLVPKVGNFPDFLTPAEAGAGAGNIIQIDHGGGWFTTYIHLQTRLVGVGHRVVRGTGIGRVGHTGETSNGVPHLHFEMAVDRNGDGRAEWGHANNERTTPVFNGVTYGQGNSQTHQITSRNCGTAIDEIGVFRPSAGDWFSPGRTLATNWGEPGDLPTAGDWNADGSDEITVFRPSTKTWHRPGTILRESWGERGDLPIAGNLS